MNLLDRVRLLVRSTLNSAMRGNLPEMPLPERDAKLMDKAQAQIEMLQQDVARAEKRGDTELADRLKREMNELQVTLDKARKRLEQSAQQRKPVPAASGAAPEESTAQIDTSVQQNASDTVPGEGLDNSRVADHLPKIWEDKHDNGDE